MSIKYLEDHFSVESRQDDCPPHGQRQDGYGSKISMPYMVRLNGKGVWRRVYCVIYSNVGSLYVLVNGERFYIRHDEKLEGTPSNSK